MCCHAEKSSFSAETVTFRDGERGGCISISVHKHRICAILHKASVARANFVLLISSKIKVFPLHLSTPNSKVNFSKILLHWFVCCVVFI